MLWGLVKMYKKKCCFIVNQKVHNMNVIINSWICRQQRDVIYKSSLYNQIQYVLKTYKSFIMSTIWTGSIYLQFTYYISRVIMHTHTPYATALSCLEDPTLLMVHQNSCRFTAFVKSK